MLEDFCLFSDMRRRLDLASWSSYVAQFNCLSRLPQSSGIAIRNRPVFYVTQFNNFRRLPQFCSIAIRNRPALRRSRPHSPLLARVFARVLRTLGRIGAVR